MYHLIIDGDDMGDATSFRAVFFVCVGGGGYSEQNVVGVVVLNPE
jgi:hypothetical protein